MSKEDVTTFEYPTSHDSKHGSEIEISFIGGVAILKIERIIQWDCKVLECECVVVSCSACESSGINVGDKVHAKLQ